MVAERVAEDTSASIAVIEAGNRIFDFENRFNTRRRFLDYGENPYHGDHIPGHDCNNAQSRSMSVGGLAMHWGGTTPRYSPEDFRVKSLFGVGRDWPISYEDLDPFFQEAEERIGVAGEQGPEEYDPRSGGYPMEPLPTSYNLTLAKAVGGELGDPLLAESGFQELAPLAGTARVRPLRHLLDLSHRRQVQPGFHLPEPSRRGPDHAPRPHHGAPPRPPGRFGRHRAGRRLPPGQSGRPGHHPGAALRARRRLRLVVPPAADERRGPLPGRDRKPLRNRRTVHHGTPLGECLRIGADAALPRGVRLGQPLVQALPAPGRRGPARREVHPPRSPHLGIGCRQAGASAGRRRESPARRRRARRLAASASRPARSGCGVTTTSSRRGKAP